MRLTLVQSALHWENPAANRTMFAEQLRPLAGQTDLVLLPEMFTTGFSMNTALAEPLEGEALAWLREQAAHLQAAVVGSFICGEDGRFFNRLIFMRPDGTFEHYDKRHLFALGSEHDHFTAGEKRLVVEWQGWRICPLICYDLRFPVWSRNGLSGKESSDPTENRPKYDLLLYVANWPTRRVAQWNALLPARAIENQAFVAGVNIYGVDGNGLEYVGDSQVADFSGKILDKISGQAGLATAELSLEDLRAYQNQLPFLADADRFTLH